MTFSLNGNRNFLIVNLAALILAESFLSLLALFVTNLVKQQRAVGQPLQICDPLLLYFQCCATAASSAAAAFLHFSPPRKKKHHIIMVIIKVTKHCFPEILHQS